MWRLLTQTLPDGTPPIEKIHPFRKIAMIFLTYHAILMSFRI